LARGQGWRSADLGQVPRAIRGIAGLRV